VELLLLFAVALFFAGVPFAAAALADRFRPGWPRKRKILVAALPLPGLVALLSGGALVDALWFVPRGHAMDGGMLMLLGMGGAVLSVLSAGLGFAVSTSVLRAR
jgi:hypothetical protein